MTERRLAAHPGTPLPLATVGLLVSMVISTGCAAGEVPSSADESAAAPVRVEVLVHNPWQPTGVMVSAGASVTFDASGSYVFHSAGHESGPDGLPDAVPFLGAWPANELTGLALIGKLGKTGPAFLIGSHAQMLADTTGELFVMVNDDILDENSGTLTLEVTVMDPTDDTTTESDDGVGAPGNR